MTARQSGRPAAVVGEVVVGDDEVEAEGLGFGGGGEGADAGVDADDETDAGGGGLAEDVGLHAVAFADAVRDVVGDLWRVVSLARPMRSMVVLSRTVAVVPSTS